jgi:hypothetical protein
LAARTQQLLRHGESLPAEADMPSTFLHSPQEQSSALYAHLDLDLSGACGFGVGWTVAVPCIGSPAPQRRLRADPGSVRSAHPPTLRPLGPVSGSAGRARQGRSSPGAPRAWEARSGRPSTAADAAQGLRRLTAADRWRPLSTAAWATLGARPVRTKLARPWRRRLPARVMGEARPGRPTASWVRLERAAPGSWLARCLTLGSGRRPGVVDAGRCLAMRTTRRATDRDQAGCGRIPQNAGARTGRRHLRGSIRLLLLAAGCVSALLSFAVPAAAHGAVWVRQPCRGHARRAAGEQHPDDQDRLEPGPRRPAHWTRLPRA